jgi:hypothetical protein
MRRIVPARSSHGTRTAGSCNLSSLRRSIRAICSFRETIPAVAVVVQVWLDTKMTGVVGVSHMRPTSQLTRRISLHWWICTLRHVTSRRAPPPQRSTRTSQTTLINDQVALVSSPRRSVQLIISLLLHKWHTVVRGVELVRLAGVCERRECSME